MPKPRRGLTIPPGSPSVDRPSAPTTLPSMDDRAEAMRDHLETHGYTDRNGRPHVFDGLPSTGDEHSDDDEE
jgi:hypothetical protein